MTLTKTQLAQLLQDLEFVKKWRKFETYFTSLDPFPRDAYIKHLEFFKAGAKNHIRAFTAGNRVGKTVAAAYELTLHLTGLYPDWWEGKRFTTCNHWWVCGVDSRTISTVLQPMLLGPVGEFGSGMIPRDHLDFDTLKDAKKADTIISNVRVRHVNGTYSSFEFKSYESGRESFQGAAVSVWLDEEPPLAVYTECLMRTATGNNCLMATFTPLKGISDTILSFFEGGDFSTGQVGDSKYVVMAGWDDVPHLDESTKRILIAATPPYQREARTKGIPQLGSGAIFPVAESTFVVEPFEIPSHWPKAYGFDVGRNTSAVWIALDRESGVIYTYSDYFIEEGLPSTHAAAIKARGDWIRGAIDTASRGRSQTDGENLYQIYTDLGLKIQNADKAVESGLLEMLELLTQGRLKVFSTCRRLLEEFRMYRRDEKGRVVKKNDHVMDAWRYAIHTRDKVLKTKAEAASSLILDLGDNGTDIISSPWG